MVTTQGKPEVWRPYPDEKLSGNAYREFQDMRLTNLTLPLSESTGETPQARLPVSVSRWERPLPASAPHAPSARSGL